MYASSQEVKGEICKPCINRYFVKFTLTTAVDRRHDLIPVTIAMASSTLIWLPWWILETRRRDVMTGQRILD